MKETTKIVILGGNGQIGWELVRCLKGTNELFAPGRDELNLLQPFELEHYVRNVKPNIIINAAGYTEVDKAEVEREKARQTNAEASVCSIWM